MGVIVVVANEGNLQAIAELREAYGWRKTSPVIGGPRRQDSVRLGLEALSPGVEWVLVHDGARPFVAADIIMEELRCAAATGSAAVDCSELARIQTPQVLRRDILDRAVARVLWESESVHEYIRRLKKFEEDISSQINDIHLSRLTLIDGAMDEILRGLLSLGQGWQPSSDLSHARILLIIRTVNCLRSARILLAYGYYEQVMSLLRSCHENTLTARDAEHTPQTVERLKTPTQFNYTEMAGRADKAAASEGNFKESWKRIYRDLSDYSHPGGSIRQFLPPEKEGQPPVLQLGSYYNEDRIVAGFVSMGTQIIAFAEVIEKAMNDEGIEWGANKAQIQECMASMVEAMRPTKEPE